MDRALIKSQEKFRKRALAQPTVEKRKSKHPSSQPAAPPPKKHKSSGFSVRPPPDADPFEYRKAPTGASTKFSILAKIVNFMKSRHHSGDTHPLDLEEILEEAKMLDVPHRVKIWLATEALVSNPKLEQKELNKFTFKPKLAIRNRKGLLSLLKKNDLKGLGTVFMEDVEEAVPNALKEVERLKDQVAVISRPDKKKIIVANDKSSLIEISEVFKQHWNSASVDGIDDQKVEEYLNKQGLASMQDLGVQRVVLQKKRKKPVSKKRTFKKLNDHLADELLDYQ